MSPFQKFVALSDERLTLILLASASPRRAEILRRHGVDFLVQAASIDEAPLPQERPSDYVLRLAQAKASDRAGCLAAASAILVLAADTTVSIEGQILGKPENRDHFLHMMSCLSGSTHQVYSGVAINCGVFDEDASDRNSLVVTTKVTFRKLLSAEIERYWESGEPQDKAGGYAIQGLAAEFVERIEGSYSNVVGLPVMETMQLLRRWNIKSHLSHSSG